MRPSTIFANTCRRACPHETAEDVDNGPMRSRQKVLNATLRLIEDGGFEGVNVAAVASAAGVSRQTVYSIFAGPEDAVDGLP